MSGSKAVWSMVKVVSALLILGASISDASAASPTILYSFTGADDAYPESGVVIGTDGNLYGTTDGAPVSGKPCCSGEIFKITPAGSFSALHVFTDGADGAQAHGGLALGPDGNFYGTAYKGGGTNGHGTIFRITPDGVLTNLHVFQGGADGEYPTAGLTLAGDGNFYGGTEGWVDDNYGTLFSISPTGAYTLIHSFNCTDGRGPAYTLTRGSNGNVYGTLPSCSAFPFTFFELGTDGSQTPLFDETSYTVRAIVPGSDGNFYAASSTATGGQTVLLKIDASGAATVINSNAPTNSQLAFQGSDGNFYGYTTYAYSSGTRLPGSVIRVSPDGVTSTLYTFAGGSDGDTPSGLVQGVDGNLYGTTEFGGAAGYGTVFKLQVPMAPPPPAKLTAASKSTGSITLSWTAAAGATGYNVYMGRKAGGESATPVRKNVASTHVTLTGLTSGARYYFKVAAVNANGVGLMSPEATAKAQ